MKARFENKIYAGVVASQYVGRWASCERLLPSYGATPAAQIISEIEFRAAGAVRTAVYHKESDDRAVLI